MKFDLLFLLENAAWPSLLVEEGGTLRRCNQAALALFGPVLEADTALLTAIWSPENTFSAEQFIGRPAHTSTAPSRIKFKVKGGATTNFSTYVSAVARDEQKYVVLQLFQEGTGVMESNAAHKQKLDCALQLARSVALDFNNALTSVLGHTSLLLSKTEVKHPWRSSLVEIEKSAAKAAEIANDLANFSRNEKEGRAQTSGNLNAILERTIEAFRTAEREHISWTLQFERKLFSANFDEAKMQQTFARILENAVESISGKGSITVQTRNLELTEATQDRTAKLSAGTYICVEFSDTGLGIAPETLLRIFEPFFTTKGTPHRGLGLVWVYGIVTNHGGGVAVSSESGVGTAVRVYLPANKTLIKETAANVHDFNGTETILLVDDEDLLLTMGQMILSSYGYDVLVANSGKKALEVFGRTQKTIQVMVTDLVMPNMSGRELSEKVRQISPGTRIICASGYVRANNAEESEFYLQKPFTSQDLLRKVKQVLAAPY